jgi:hypothetical protein
VPSLPTLLAFPGSTYTISKSVGARWQWQETIFVFQSLSTCHQNIYVLYQGLLTEEEGSERLTSSLG